MVSLKYLVLSSALMVTAMGQTVDPLSIFLSEAYSVYTEVTSILSNEATANSQSSATSSGSSAASTSSGSGSSTTPTSSSGSSSTGSSVAAAATTTASGSGSTSGGNHHDRNLAIILGCALGALALGLLVLVLLLCCRRRRQRSRTASPRHRALSPEDAEIESWRQHPSPVVGSDEHALGHNSRPHTAGGAVVAPPMSEHPAFRQSREHENPFVPVPPPPRRNAPNSRAGLTDGTGPVDEPYLTEKSGHTPLDSKIGHEHDSSHKGGALAAGAAGAALGAAAMHHHGKHNDEKHMDEKHNHEAYIDEKHIDEKHLGDDVHDEKSGLLPTRERTINRKPVPIQTPVSNAQASESWPYSPDSTVLSSDSTVPTTTSPVAAGSENAVVADRPVDRRSTESARRSLSRDPARANAVFDQEYSDPPTHDHNHHPVMTGAAGLAAGAVGGAALAHHRGHSTERSRSPRRQSLGATKDRRSDQSDSSSNSNGYSDAVARQPHSGTAGHDFADSYNVPPTPPTRSRRNSPFGNAAPAAAAYSYHNRPVSLERRRDRTPPAVPSRSPGRQRYSDAPYERTSTSPYRYSSQAASEAVDDEPLPNKGIVGDNGYPHLGLPRRKSGGEYDYNRTGPLGPQTLAKNQSRFPQTPPAEPSDDSTWRLSSGMPGGWQRDNSRRNSLDVTRPTTMAEDSPRNSGTFVRGAGERDSAISGISGTTLGRSPPVTNVGPGRRLRLADLRREEEERGRQSMEAEWVGNGGYDGYGYQQPHHPGVGQAL